MVNRAQAYIWGDWGGGVSMFLLHSRLYIKQKIKQQQQRRRRRRLLILPSSLPRSPKWPANFSPPSVVEALQGNGHTEDQEGEEGGRQAAATRRALSKIQIHG